MRQIVPHASPAFHQLNLFFINLEYSPVGISGSFMADHKTIGQRSDLMVVPYTRHGASLRNDVFEMIQQMKYLLLAHGIRIFLLYPGKFRGQPLVHVFGRAFVKVPKRVFHGIFVDPDRGGQFIIFEVLLCFGQSFLIGKNGLCILYIRIHHAINKKVTN